MEKKTKPNKIKEVRNQIKLQDVLDALDEFRAKPNRKIKTKKYFIVDKQNEFYDTKDVFARAANIANNNITSYSFSDFRGGMCKKRVESLEKCNRVGDFMRLILEGTEYHVTCDELSNESEYVGEIENIPKILEGHERDRVIKARVNQGQFRGELLCKHGKCCLCGVDIQCMLIASHIKSWKDSNNKEKVDENNGLLLCANHDKLFDKHLISFNDDGSILISKEIDEHNKELLHVDLDMKIKVDEEMKKYLAYHRKLFFQTDH